MCQPTFRTAPYLVLICVIRVNLWLISLGVLGVFAVSVSALPVFLLGVQPFFRSRLRTAAAAKVKVLAPPVGERPALMEFGLPQQLKLFDRPSVRRLSTLARFK